MSDRWSVLNLHHSDLRLALLPGVGGRLWDVEFEGRSLLFQNPDLAGHAFDETNLAALPTRSPQFGFPLWGGEKTWIAPDTSWASGAPFTALDSGAYRITSQSETQIEMTSAVCPISHLSVTRLITLKTEHSWTIDHSVTNKGTSSRAMGIWSVMMINTPVKIGVRAQDSGYHPVFGNAVPLVSAHPECIVAECTRKQEFKVGLPNPHGVTLIKFGNGGPWLKCSVLMPRQGDSFAHQYPTEVFNSGDYDYCEAEWHSAQTSLMSGETLNFQQHFQVIADDDALNAPERIITNKEFMSCMS